MQNFIHRTALGILAKAIPRVKNLYVSHGKQSVQEVYFNHRNPVFIFDGIINPAASPHIVKMRTIRVNLEMLRDFY